MIKDKFSLKCKVKKRKIKEVLDALMLLYIEDEALDEKLLGKNPKASTAKNSKDFRDYNSLQEINLSTNNKRDKKILMKHYLDNY